MHGGQPITRRGSLLLGAAGAVRLALAPFLVPPRQALFEFAIAGGHHNGLPQALPLLAPGDILDVTAELDNPHDGHAVAVRLPIGAPLGGLRLGYLPRMAGHGPALLLARGARLGATVIGSLAGQPDTALAYTGYCDGDPRLMLERIG